MYSGALPLKAADLALVAPEAIADSSAAPEPFTRIGRRQIRVELQKKMHVGATDWAMRVVG